MINNCGRRIGLSLLALSMAVGVTTGLSVPARAADPTACAKIHMAEPGWNDLAFTTGVASVLLKGLGYSPKSDVLGLEVIYQSLKNGDLNLFLGYWDPAMVDYYKPYKADGSVETVHQNLTGAKFTFAVPHYVYEAGVHDFADLAKYADKFDHKMYGIEPGSNQIMQDIIKQNAFGLGDWKLVESSEQGMLAEVRRAVPKQKWVLFLGWAPHPMNTEFAMDYLTGGDKYFGPDFGGATVHTQVHKGFMQQCPNVAQLLNNLTFDIPTENTGMGYIINDSLKPTDAATKVLKANPQLLDPWLKGVTTIDGKDGLTAVKAELGL
ncbi:MAG TPA: choline ABC transporter substrate-binding protein [Terriglobales bacterium]|nr:choline ABC transporter substrate-binding protein [Terriglobales bacterium]